MPFAAQLGLGVLWFLIGCVIAIPYTFLANGNFDDFFITAWIAPAATVLMFISYTLRHVGRRDTKELKWGGWFFWALMTYLCLPIILNGASLLLKWMGYGAASHYAFEGRFVGLAVIPVAVAIYGAIADCVQQAWERLHSKEKPSDGNHTTPV